jgi:hypothetical protein
MEKMGNTMPIGEFFIKNMCWKYCQMLKSCRLILIFSKAVHLAANDIKPIYNGRMEE